MAIYSSSSYSSTYKYYRSQGATMRAYNKQVLDQYDSQVAALGPALFGTIASSGSQSVNLGFNVAVKRITAEQQKQINAALADLKSTQDVLGGTSSGTGSTVNVLA